MSQSPAPLGSHLRTTGSARPRRRSRLVRMAVGISTLASLAPFAIGTAHASAATNPKQSAAAAAYLRSVNAQGRTFAAGGPGTDADCLVGLAAITNQPMLANQLDATLKSEAAGYAKSGGAAGKVAIAAAVMGDDPTTYGGVNLVQTITSAFTKDPTLGYPMSAALGMLGLARNHVTVPQAAIDALVKAQSRDGSWGYIGDKGVYYPDYDATAVAIDALTAVPQSTAVTNARTRAVNFATRTVTPSGYWQGYSPVNTTGLMVSALRDAGISRPASTTWLLAQQARTKEGGFSNVLNGTASDVMATCQALPAIAGASYATALYRPAATQQLGDANGDGIADVYGVDAAGNLRFYSGYTDRQLSPVGVRATGWGTVTYIAQLMDPAGSGRSDLLARRADGTLWLYPGVGMGHVAQPRPFGHGWNSMTAIVPVGNLAGGSTQYVVARRTDGALFRYQVSANGLVGGTQIGHGWNSMTAMVGIGNFIGDSSADVLTVRADGTLWAYAGQRNGTLANGREVGHGWSGFTSVFSPGNISGGPARDLVGRRSDGSVFAYENLGGTWSAARQIGSGMSDLRLMA